MSPLSWWNPMPLDGAVPPGPAVTSWHVAPSVVIGTLGLVAGYVLVTGPLARRRPSATPRRVSRGQMTSFLAGCAVLLVALGPPLDGWADHYLLSAHMVQHVLLMVAVAPLWLAGTPDWMVRPVLRWRVVARIGYRLTRPWPAFALPNLVFALWHLTGPYDAVLRSPALHVVEHLCFLGVALLAWWPIFGPLPEWPRPSLPVQCLYLFAQTFPGALIGTYITFAPAPLYTPYASAPRLWGIGLTSDQQLAGLLMWAVVPVVYFVCFLTPVFFRWAAQSERGDAASVPRDLPPWRTSP